MASPAPNSAASALMGELISDDRQCGRCNYPLRGLRAGMACPECGTLIAGTRRASRHRDALTDAPLSYLRSLRLGALFMAGGSLLACVSTFIAYGTQNPIVAAFGLLGAATWWGGVYIVTAPERHNTTVSPAAASLAATLRIINRTLQSLWLLSLLILFASTIINLQAVQARAAAPGSLNATNPFFSLSTLGSQLIRIHGIMTPFCLLALVPMSIHIGRLAEWAENEELRDRMRLVAWGIAIGAPLASWGGYIAAHSSSVIALLFTVGKVFGLIMLIIAWLAFLWGTLSLASMCSWAVANAIETMDTNARLAVKLASHLHTIAPNVEALNKPGVQFKAQSLPGEIKVAESSDGPIPLAEPEGPPKKIKQG